jgi:hypothetical protein
MFTMRSLFRSLLLASLIGICMQGCSTPEKGSLQSAEYQANQRDSQSHTNGKATSPQPPSTPDEIKPEVLTVTPAPSASPAPTIAPGALQKPQLQRIAVKGIYVSAWSTNGSKFQELVSLVDKTDLNAMVIDIKNDGGQITYPSQVPLVQETGANDRVIIPDLQERIKLLKGKNIYTIARLVVFKDPYLAGKKASYALQSRSGNLWRDKKGVAWVDPFKEEVWDYNIAIAKEAADLGFDEIQFDYIRFPENGKTVDAQVKYDNPHGWSKSQAIQAFVKKAKDQLPSSVRLSADVFGMTTSTSEDMGIGQDWAKISQEVDIISPMLYPSHYSRGIYGVKTPDLQPYSIIKQAIADAKAKNVQLQQTYGKIATIRPWYQDFTATWVKPHKKYGVQDVKEQIKAAKEQGIDDFLLWNSTSSYTYR